MPESVNTRPIIFDRTIPAGLIKTRQKAQTHIDTSYKVELTGVTSDVCDDIESYKIKHAQENDNAPKTQTSLIDWVVAQSEILTYSDFTNIVGRIIDNEALFTSEAYEAHIDTPEISFEKIELDVENIFVAAREETFENGMITKFSHGILSIVRQHGDSAIDALKFFILNEKVNPEIAGEALRWLGDMDDEPTYLSRRDLLEKALAECSSPMVKDGANIGLAFMDDPHAIPFLRMAIKAEKNKMFCELYQQTLDQLEDTKKCLNS